MPLDDTTTMSGFRMRRFATILGLIDAVLATRPVCRMLDVGGTSAYWRAVQSQLGGRRVEVTVVNLLAQDEPVAGVTCLVGDATDLSQFADASFDLVHSNSVIEHLGPWRNMVRMAGEVRRLAPSYYVQVPNFWFPYEPHAETLFFHWLPAAVRASMLVRKRRGYYAQAATVGDAMASVEDARCLTRAEVAFLFPDAVVQGEMVLGLAKSWTAVRRSA